jgi:hypothetical protein
MRNSCLKAKRDADIKKDYATLNKELKTAVVFERLSQKYYLAPTTLIDIVYKKEA